MEHSGSREFCVQCRLEHLGSERNMKVGKKDMLGGTL